MAKKHLNKHTRINLALTRMHKSKGETVYDDKVIQKIIGSAIDKIDGLLTVNGGFFSNATERLVNRAERYGRN